MENCILQVLSALLAVIITRYAVPYVKANLTMKKFAFINGWINKAVAAAEQSIRGSKLGTKKKEYVIKLLKQVGITVDETVDALIEAAVKEMNNNIDKASTELAQTLTK
jgi:phage I-like protein